MPGTKHSTEYKLIAKSKYFNRRWYLKHYPDVASSGIDPVKHYLRYGWREGRNPGPNFNTREYLRNNEDVRAANINPLLHYEKNGKYEASRIISIQHCNSVLYAICRLYRWLRPSRRLRNILMISHELTYTGAPLSLLKSAQILKDAGYKITLVSLKDGPLGAEFVNIGRVIITPSLDKICRIAANADVAIVNTLVPYDAYNMLKDLLPTIWWVREPVETLERNTFMKSVFMNATNVYTMSPFSRDEFLKYNSAVRVIKHGLDDYYAGSVSFPRRPTFAVVGTICHRKGQDVFIDAVKKLPSKIRNRARFIIVGKVSISDAAFQQMNIPDYIDVMPEISDVGRMMDFYSNVSCVVVPSRREPTSRTALESMMMGRPVIMSDRVGAKYLLNGRNGVIFENENSAQLSKILAKMIDSPSAIRNMEKWSRRAYLENNAISVYRRNLIDMLNTAVGAVTPVRWNKILVHLHLFYPEQLDWFLRRLKNITCNYDLCVTVVKPDATVEKKIMDFKPDAKILVVPNRGYDVYPFWLALQDFSLSDYDFVLKLHTKNSRTTKWTKNGISYTGFEWRDDLINPLIGSRRQFHRVRRLLACPGVGMVGAANLIGDRENAQQMNNTKKLCDKMGIRYFDKCPFVCGTMFAIKSDLLREFQNYPFRQSDFSAESKTGSVGTTAHSLETVFGILVANGGLKLAGVHNSATWRKALRANMKQFYIKLLKKTKQYKNDVEYIRHSRLFDKKWYLKTYPDVAACGISPAQHYLNFGWLDGKNPSPKFNTRLYLDNNRDVASAAINPLLHYEKHGKYENRFTGTLGRLSSLAVKELCDARKMCSCNTAHVDRPVIISLTTYPARIGSVHHTVRSLRRQSVTPDKIILYLSYEEFPKMNRGLPRNLTAMLDDVFEIHWIDKTLRSFQKLIPALCEYPDAIIVTADDDILYDDDWLARLLDAYKSAPNLIHCHRAHRIKMNGKYVAPYNSWHMAARNESVAYNNFLTGVGGVLYPPHCLDENVINDDEFLELCPRADDIWIWAMAVKNHTKIHIIRDNIAALNFVPGSQDGECLWKINTVDTCYNDVQLKNVLEKYPMILDIIRRERNRSMLAAYLLYPWYWARYQRIKKTGV